MGRDMESYQFEQLYKMMSVINEEHYDRKNQHNRRYQTRPYMQNYNNDDLYNSNNKYNYNNKYGMNDNKMDMNKFEKMFQMISEMKSQKQQYEAPVAAMRSSMDSDMPDFEKMANYMANFRSKRAADTDSLA